LGVDHVLVATGATWAADTVGRHSVNGLERAAPGMVASAEPVLDRQEIAAEHVVIYDDDHYYMGTVLALQLRAAGHRVTLVTPAGRPCEYGTFTTEIWSSNAALIEA